jgi:uncharacterized RDD family membrane protein YckC
MKCPKCGYLGFESVDRCRNCGYEFSLIPATDSPDLPIRTHTAREGAPLDDLTLLTSGPAPGASPQATPDLDKIVASRRAAPSGELPLFGGPLADDVPLITKASPPRPPLSVRRATPEVPKLRAVQARAPMLDLAPPPQDFLLSAGSRSGLQDGLPGEEEVAGIPARMTASAIDLAILGAIDLLVLYFTMQICGLAPSDLAILPKVPLIAFLLAQNAGYFVVFTTGGQTLGKMVVGIKVVPSESNASVDLGHAILRTLVWLVLAVPAGLGFASAFFSRDHRGLHDRCAGTCVVRASN